MVGLHFAGRASAVQVKRKTRDEIFGDPSLGVNETLEEIDRSGTPAMPGSPQQTFVESAVNLPRRMEHTRTFWQHKCLPSPHSRHFSPRQLTLP
jgi:hypothetical protein